MSKTRKPPTFRDAVKTHGDTRDQLSLRHSGTNTRTHPQGRSNFERVNSDTINPEPAADARQSESGYPQQSSIPTNDRHLPIGGVAPTVAPNRLLTELGPIESIDTRKLSVAESIKTYPNAVIKRAAKLTELPSASPSRSDHRRPNGRFSVAKDFAQKAIAPGDGAPVSKQRYQRQPQPRRRRREAHEPLAVRGGFHPPPFERAVEFAPFAVIALRYRSGLPPPAREIATSFGVNVCR
jgi:hypothetical protein